MISPSACTGSGRFVSMVTVHGGLVTDVRVALVLMEEEVPGEDQVIEQGPGRMMQRSSRPSSGRMSGPQRNGGWPRMPLLAIKTCDARGRRATPSTVRRNRRGWNPSSAEGRPEVGEPAEPLFVLAVRVADHQGVDPDADVGEVVAVADLHRVDGAMACALASSWQAPSRSTGMPSSRGQHVGRAQRNDAERDRAPDQAVGDARDRAIAPGRDDQVEARGRAPRGRPPRASRPCPVSWISQSGSPSARWRGSSGRGRRGPRPPRSPPPSGSRRRRFAWPGWSRWCSREAPHSDGRKSPKVEAPGPAYLARPSASARTVLTSFKTACGVRNWRL